MSSFEPPVPDPAKLLDAWQQWEKGDEMPGRTLATLKTHGLAQVLARLVETGWNS